MGSGDRFIGGLLAFILLFVFPLPSNAEIITNFEDQQRTAIEFVLHSARVNQAAEEYVRKHPRQSLRSITYGELVREGTLPESYCQADLSLFKDTVYTCGQSAPGFEEYRKTHAPVVIKKDLRRSTLVYVFPYKDHPPRVVDTIKKLSGQVDLNFASYGKYILLFDRIKHTRDL
jgi:hypothetical protein